MNGSFDWSRIQRRVQRVLPLFVFFISCIAYSCSKDVYWVFDDLEYLEEHVVDTVPFFPPPPREYRDWESDSIISLRQYGPLRFSHQSAAAYNDYAVFVADGRSKMCLYNLKEKKIIYTLDLNGVKGSVYHCNQSSFGFEKYEPNDFFPLLYVSQRAKTDGRCFVEVYRLYPLYNEDVSEFDSFYVELVQTIYLPKLSYDNCLGNANCVIDGSTRTMFTYSRNNDSQADNYGRCVISRFAVPDIHQKTVILNDEAILSSFTIDADALNMQGGCIQDGMLYIGQGYLSVGYIYLNIIDLEKEKLVRRIDLPEYRFVWEPEGCFFYDGSVMLAHIAAIWRIDKE